MVTAKMNAYLADLIEQRLAVPRDDLLTRLVQAELDGERLAQEDILGSSSFSSSPPPKRPPI